MSLLLQTSMRSGMIRLMGIIESDHRSARAAGRMASVARGKRASAGDAVDGNAPTSNESGKTARAREAAEATGKMARYSAQAVGWWLASLAALAGAVAMVSTSVSVVKADLRGVERKAPTWEDIRWSFPFCLF